jgi:hypothetical protein
VQREPAPNPYFDFKELFQRYKASAGRNEAGGLEVNAGFYGPENKALYGQMQAGKWRDDDGAARYGEKHEGGVVHGDFNKRGSVSGQVDILTASHEGSVGENGATLSGGLTAVGGSATAGKFDKGSNTDVQGRFGLSAGPSAGARLHWGDSDEDGYNEYGFGFDIGPASVDIKTEDPARTYLGALAGAPGIALSHILPGGNLTGAVGDAAGSAVDAVSDFFSPSVTLGSALETYKRVEDYKRKLKLGQDPSLSSLFTRK